MASEEGSKIMLALAAQAWRSGELELHAWKGQRVSATAKLRATSHTSLKARDHYNLRAARIGRKGGDRPSSLHT